MEISTCRICLAENIRMHSIVSTELQFVYEKLTEHLFDTEGKPLVTCYICTTRLQNCHQLMLKCYRSEEILNQILSGVKIDRSVIKEELSNYNELSVTSMLKVSISDVVDVDAEIKEEIIEPENQDDGDMMAEVDITPEQSSKLDMYTPSPVSQNLSKEIEISREASPKSDIEVNTPSPGPEELITQIQISREPSPKPDIHIDLPSAENVPEVRYTRDASPNPNCVDTVSNLSVQLDHEYTIPLGEPCDDTSLIELNNDKDSSSCQSSLCLQYEDDLYVPDHVVTEVEIYTEPISENIEIDTNSNTMEVLTHAEVSTDSRKRPESDCLQKMSTQIHNTTTEVQVHLESPASPEPDHMEEYIETDHSTSPHPEKSTDCLQPSNAPEKSISHSCVQTERELTQVTYTESPASPDPDYLEEDIHEHRDNAVMDKVLTELIEMHRESSQTPEPSQVEAHTQTGELLPTQNNTESLLSTLASPKRIHVETQTQTLPATETMSKELTNAEPAQLQSLKSNHVEAQTSLSRDKIQNEVKVNKGHSVKPVAVRIPENGDKNEKSLPKNDSVKTNSQKLDLETSSTQININDQMHENVHKPDNIPTRKLTRSQTKAKGKPEKFTKDVKEKSTEKIKAIKRKIETQTNDVQQKMTHSDKKCKVVSPKDRADNIESGTQPIVDKICNDDLLNETAENGTLNDKTPNRGALNNSHKYGQVSNKKLKRETSKLKGLDNKSPKHEARGNKTPKIKLRNVDTPKSNARNVTFKENVVIGETSKEEIRTRKRSNRKLDDATNITNDDRTTEEKSPALRRPQRTPRAAKICVNLKKKDEIASSKVFLSLLGMPVPKTRQRNTPKRSIGEINSSKMIDSGELIKQVRNVAKACMKKLKAEKNPIEISNNTNEDNALSDSNLNLHTSNFSVDSSLCIKSPRPYRYKNKTCKEMFDCHLCDFSTNRKRFLLAHIRLHTGGKPHKCHICDRSFKIKQALENHIRTHTGEKPFQCDVCQKAFKVKHHVITHMRTHTGERPYKCFICNASFARSDNLKAHVYCHAGIKPFKCEVCKHGFADAKNLRIHMRLHTGEKPYKCDKCDKAYRDRNSLTYHIRNVCR